MQYVNKNGILVQYNYGFEGWLPSDKFTYMYQIWVIGTNGVDGMIPKCLAQYVILYSTKSLSDGFFGSLGRFRKREMDII